MILKEKTTDGSDYITFKFDLLFKKVFGNKNDLIPIKYLIKNILNMEVNQVTILNSELIGRPYKDKKVQVDLVVELEEGTKVSVEINTNVTQEYIERNLYYLLNISKDLKPGKRFKKLNRHIQINIDYNGYHKKPIIKYAVMEEEEGEKLTNMIEIIRIDIPYFKEKCYNEDIIKLDSLTKFLGLFGIEKLEFAKELCKGDESMEDIMDRIEEYNHDEDLIGAYNYEDKMELISQIREEEAMKVGTEKGLQQGIKQSKVEIVKNMLKENADVNFISRVTGLSITVIENLKDV